MGERGKGRVCAYSSLGVVALEAVVRMKPCGSCFYNFVILSCSVVVWEME